MNIYLNWSTTEKDVTHPLPRYILSSQNPCALLRSGIRFAKDWKKTDRTVYNFSNKIETVLIVCPQSDPSFISLNSSHLSLIISRKLSKLLNCMKSCQKNDFYVNKRGKKPVLKNSLLFQDRVLLRSQKGISIWSHCFRPLQFF